MRLAAVLASLTVAAIHPALAADPPGAPATPGKDASVPVQAPAGTPTSNSPPAIATTTPTAATTSTTATPTTATATSPAAAPAEADPDAARLENRMRARGYTTRMQNGEKIFCRREQVLGTRLGGALHCMHEDEARANEDRLQGDEESARQRLMGSCVPNGSVGGKASFNCGG